MPFHRDVWWLMGSMAAAIAAAPLIVHGDAQTTARRKAAAQKIEQLSPAERQELEQNFKRFEKLTAADQAKYRDIHAKLQANPAVGEAMTAFSHLLANVSAREQAEIFGQLDVRQRIAAVTQIQEEIDKERGGRFFFGGRFRRDGIPGPSLPRDSFYEIMQTLEALASESYSIPKEQLPEIQKLDVKNPQRYVKLFTALHDEKKKTWSDLVPNPSIENRLVESISDKKVQEQMRELLRRGSGGPSGQKHFWIRLQLAATLGRELYFEMLKRSFGEEELARKLASLSKEERDELYSLPAEDSRFQLKMRILRDLGTESKAAIPPVQEFFQLKDYQSGGMWGPGFSPGARRDGPGRDGQPGRSEPGRGEGGPGRDGPQGRGDGFGRGEGPQPGGRNP